VVRACAIMLGRLGTSGIICALAGALLRQAEHTLGAESESSAPTASAGGGQYARRGHT
jgi:hypothetical protein